MWIIGHRGSGSNGFHHSRQSQFSLTENSLESFNQAFCDGATHFEFDVQVTADGIPVVFHDWSVRQGGNNVPIHKLSFKGLLTLLPWILVTLQDVLLRLMTSNSSHAVNIEIKYPLEHESLDLPCTISEWPDMDTYLKTIFDVIKEAESDSKKVFISSFHPDVCLKVAKEFPDINVMLLLEDLTESKSPEKVDRRIWPMENAISFVKENGLKGVVLQDSLLKEKSEKEAREKLKDMKVLTWGSGNNDASRVLWQLKTGLLDGLITDSVKLAKEQVDKVPIKD